jgi:hypothetical protein
LESNRYNCTGLSPAVISCNVYCIY